MQPDLNRRCPQGRLDYESSAFNHSAIHAGPSLGSGEFGGIRTPDTAHRKRTLYSPELQTLRKRKTREILY